MRVLLLPHGLMPTTFIFLMLLLSAEALPLDSAGVHHHQRFLYDAPFLPASSDRNLFVVGIGDGFGNPNLWIKSVRVFVLTL